MKTQLLTLSIATFITACTGNQKENQATDTTTAIFHPKPTPAQLNADSIRRDSIYDPTVKIAYGKVMFGMNKDQYDTLMPDTLYKLGSYYYAFVPQFNDKGELYGIYFQGEKKPANEIDNELVEQLKDLYDTMKELHGEITYDFGRPKLSEFKPGKVQWEYNWELNRKTINAGMIEEKTGSEYRTAGIIFDSHMNRAVLKKLTH